MAGFRVTYATMSADDAELNAAYTPPSNRSAASWAPQHPLWIGDDERFGETFTTVSPLDTSVAIGHFTLADGNDIDDVVAAAAPGPAGVGGDAVARALRHPRPGRRPDLASARSPTAPRWRGRTGRAGSRRSARSRRRPT